MRSGILKRSMKKRLKISRLKAELPIGVFDSGLGGLTVYKKLREKMPFEDFIYLGDTARVPYGSKSAGTIINFSIQISRFLLEREVKLIVVACNTASSLALDRLKEISPVPVVGVIEAGVKGAVNVSRAGHCAVIGTEATIGSGAYPLELQRRAAGMKMTAKACPLFVPIVEEGWAAHRASELVAEEYLAEIRDSGADTLVLGCTHYPILEVLISETLGKEFTVINPAEAVADEVWNICDSADILHPGPDDGRDKFYVTDIPGKFHELSRRFLGYELESVEQLSIEILEKYALQ